MEQIMNSITVISAAAILSAAIATPVLAQDVGTNGRHAIAHQQMARPSEPF
jgi:hypothetical protein